METSTLTLKQLLTKYDKGILGFPSDAVLNKMAIDPKKLHDLLFEPQMSITPPLYHVYHSKKHFVAVLEDYIPHLHCMIQVRYAKLYTFKDCKEALEGLGYKVSSTGQLGNIFNRLELKLGLREALRTNARITKKNKETRARTGTLPRSKGQRESLKKASKASVAKRKIDSLQKEVRKERIKLSKASAKENVTLKEARKDRRPNIIRDADIPKDRKVLYRPHPKQALFHAAGEKIVLYGGAAGGGKSYSMLMDALRYCQEEDYRALIIRKASTMLKELIGVSRQLYPKAFPGAKFNKSENVWYFPSGATIEFGYLDKDEDLERYQGLPYAYIGFDEIQHQRSPAGFEYLMSRLRSANPNITCYMRASANPGGSAWVKEYFIDPAPVNTTFWKNGLSWKFIPATLADNPSLDTPEAGSATSAYRKMLMAMPETQRKQLLEGDWLVGDDQMFAFNPIIHVTEDYPPEHWNRIRAMDYGYRDPASTLWTAVSPEGTLVVYDEHELIETPAVEWASQVLQKERMDSGPFGVAGPLEEVIDWSVFKNTGHTGPGILEQVNRLGMRPIPADRNREAGWNQIHNRLALDVDGKPSIFIHESREKLIEQVQSARINPKKPDDIDDKRVQSKGRKHHWDLLDCLRYTAMARPSTLNFAERSLRFKTGQSMEDTWAKFG